MLVLPAHLPYRVRVLARLHCRVEDGRLLLRSHIVDGDLVRVRARVRGRGTGRGRGRGRGRLES